MEDHQIVDLFWKRSEEAISETSNKYGKYCYSISYNILTNQEDAEECVADTWLSAWNSIPPRRPSYLAAFLGRITRNMSIDRWRTRSRYKRGGGEVTLALEELEECVSDGQTVESVFERKQLTRTFNEFLDSLPETERRVFLRRYWYLDSVRDISERLQFSESKVTSMLFRTRKKLRKVLEKEGFL